MKTKVIYRIYPDGDTIAIFPELPDDRWGSRSVIYQHTGQHGGAHHTDIVVTTRMASQEEYSSLHDELTNTVGYDLTIVKRESQSMRDTRRDWAVLRAICRDSDNGFSF